MDYMILVKNNDRDTNSFKFFLQITDVVSDYW